jgi:hypothetical protein
LALLVAVEEQVLLEVTHHLAKVEMVERDCKFQ